MGPAGARQTAPAAQEVFAFLDSAFVLYVPAGVTTVRGVFLALGGPDTRAFADSTRSFGLLPHHPPELGPALARQGAAFRTLAAANGLALLGTRQAFPPASLDTLLWSVLKEAAATTSRPELAEAPLLVQASSGGTPAATRLAARHPSRVAGVVLKVPVAQVLSAFNSASSIVPAYVITAALDTLVNNSMTRAGFDSVRAGGGLWAFAEEPGTSHFTGTGAHLEAVREWFTIMVELRLPTTPGGPLREIAEESGWLGNLTSHAIAPWADYAGDRRSASWFPTQATAERWRSLVKP